MAFSHALMKYSKNQKAAKEFLKRVHSKEEFSKWFEIENGYSVGATTAWETARCGTRWTTRSSRSGSPREDRG